MAYRIVMIGAGSMGFTMAVGRELIKSEALAGSTFVLMDIDAAKLAVTEAEMKKLIAEKGAKIRLAKSNDRRRALTGADFVVTSFAPSRYPLWKKDLEIAERHGVPLLMGENGGPAGIFHALRNLTIMRGVAEDMERLCPDAWMLNFTNPMSVLCTYLYKHTSLHAHGFCHQVHGSFGVIAEMLGMEPGELQVVSGGINHMNFLLDVRRRGTGQSYMDEFIRAVQTSKWWKRNHPRVPEQRFSREFYEAFGVYPVGYDTHVIEYLPFFYPAKDWKRLGYHTGAEFVGEVMQRQKQAARELRRRARAGTVDSVEPWRIASRIKYPFPKDGTHPHYHESPVEVMEALITARPLYLDAGVTLNQGAITNLPADAAVDVPVVVVGGEVRPVCLGALPPFAAELCRRQIAVHEATVEAGLTGDRRRLLEALCLTPFVRDLATMKRMMEAYLKVNRPFIPQFFR